jgi:primosomal protein N' (replication factor Y)
VSPPEAAFAEVALLRALPGRDGLTYAVPTDLRHGLRRGMRVVAPLGRRRETGIVLGLHDVAPAGVDNIRELEAVLDAEAIVSDEVLELCRWSARYYLAGLADVLAVALPGGLRARSVRVVHVPERGAPPRGTLEAAIVEHVRAAGTIGVQQLARALARPDVPRVLQRLVVRGVLAAEERHQGPAVSTRYATVFAPARDLDAAERALLERRAARQFACYERIRAAPRARLDASELDVAGRAAAAALVKRGLVTRLREERYRETGETAAATAEPELTAAQRVAVDAVAMDAFQVFLLHGVTGSGKTEVYLQLAARARAAGRSVLMLVPEIALTPQLLTRAQQRFGDAVAVVHSGLAPGQRWDEWRRIARGEARVVVGTRSAVFAPLVDLGLVIVDEEHDAAYKQDEGLRYHGRDLAIVRGQLGKIPVVLGSATPSIESHQQALDGKYQRLTLPERVHGRPLPEVTIVDLGVGGAPGVPPNRRRRSDPCRERTQGPDRAGRPALFAGAPHRHDEDARAPRADAPLSEPPRVRERHALPRLWRAGGLPVVQREPDPAPAARRLAVSSLRLYARGARRDVRRLRSRRARRARARDRTRRGRDRSSLSRGTRRAPRSRHHDANGSPPPHPRGVEQRPPRRTDRHADGRQGA